MIRPVSHIAAMSPYARALLTVPAGVALTSLSQNESCRPPSPLIADAMAQAMTKAQLYPDPDWTELRSALSKQHQIESTSILCGNGSMELILCLALCYAGPDHAVLAPAHAYPFFRTATQLARARFDTAPEKQCQVSVDRLLQALRPDTRLVLVANPGNPTGTRISRAELLRLREGLPANVLLVIDEAYGEFADHLGEPMFDLVKRGDTVILRTFSKAYGLAGMRVGWGAFPPGIAQEIRKMMNPNNVSLAGQVSARVALGDQAYMRETCRLTAQMRDSFVERLRGTGLDVLTSYTNCALIRFADAEQATEVDKVLRSEGIVVRGQAGVGLANCLRITVGNAAEMARTADILENWSNGGRT